MTLKRTGFKRKEPAPHAAKPAKGPKQKACKACRQKFTPPAPLAVVCSVPCAIVHGKRVTAQQKAKQQRQERAEDKVKRQKMKTIPELKAEAQQAFNDYVRARDLAAGHGCICCGKFATAAALAKPGGAYDACHYRSRGSADHLRYDERNVHLGLKDCNTYGHVDYRGGLIRRIGPEAVEALESDNIGRKWTREYLEGVKQTYRAKLRELQKGQS